MEVDALQWVLLLLLLAGTSPLASLECIPVVACTVAAAVVAVALLQLLLLLLVVVVVVRTAEEDSVDAAAAGCTAEEEDVLVAAVVAEHILDSLVVQQRDGEQILVDKPRYVPGQDDQDGVVEEDGLQELLQPDTYAHWVDRFSLCSRMRSCM